MPQCRAAIATCRCGWPSMAPGIEKYLMRFSTHDPSKLGQKFVNEPELWIQTEEMTRRVLKDSGINYVEVPNEAAFYGPKIDVQVWSVIGRGLTFATTQAVL